MDNNLNENSVERRFERLNNDFPRFDTTKHESKLTWVILVTAVFAATASAVYQDMGSVGAAWGWYVLWFVVAAAVYLALYQWGSKVLRTAVEAGRKQLRSDFFNAAKGVAGRDNNDPKL